MLVDEYEQYPNEKTDVVVVSRSGSDASEPAPSAADRMFLSTAPLPRPLPLPRNKERRHGAPNICSDGFGGSII